jgi:hypothetical protein
MKNNVKKALQHFMLKIVDAKSDYSLFKYLRVSENDQQKSEKINKVKRNYGYFFNRIEDSLLANFILKISHVFDISNKKQSLSLYDVDHSLVESFVLENKIFLDSIKTLRDKKICHYDKIQPEKIIFDFKRTDLFFQDLEIFYNKLSDIENSTTLFNQNLDLEIEIDEIFDLLK